MKRLPWKYTAGLIDGEGCIKFGIKKKTVFEGQGKKEGNKVEVYYPQINLELTLAEPGFHVY